MSERKDGRWIIKWETSDGRPYYAWPNCGDGNMWSESRRDAHRFSDLYKARYVALKFSPNARVMRLVRKVAP